MTNNKYAVKDLAKLPFLMRMLVRLFAQVDEDLSVFDNATVSRRLYFFFGRVYSERTVKLR